MHFKFPVCDLEISTGKPMELIESLAGKLNAFQK